MDDFFSITNGTSLSGAVTANKLESVDEGIVEAADSTLPYSVYFWDLLYEQSHRDNEEEDRLWIALGSPILVTKPCRYSSPNKPNGPFIVYYCIGGENVNSMDLPIETPHQAIRQVSLKRGMRGAGRAVSQAAANSIKAIQQGALSGKHTGYTGQLWGGTGQKFIQSVIFLIGHVGAKMFFHCSLLYAKFFTKLLAALHCVKYFYRFAVNAIIHNQKQISRRVKANGNVFVIKPLHKHIFRT